MHAVSTNIAKPTPKWSDIVTSQTSHIQLHWLGLPDHLRFFQGHFFQWGTVSAVKRCGDARDDCLITCPPNKFSCWAVEWRMVVNVTGYTMLWCHNMTSFWRLMQIFTNLPSSSWIQLLVLVRASCGNGFKCASQKELEQGRATVYRNGPQCTIVMMLRARHSNNT